jgi:S-adenosylmethionine hydrolase
MNNFLFGMNKRKIIALITDFGDRGHFVGAMKGVILKIDPDTRIIDISHNIEPQNILEAAFTLKDTIKYFPEGTIFVVVVDPGVGLGRKSLVVKTKSGQIILCPDNGILTEVLIDPGLVDVRVISEAMNRLPGSKMFHTFHGRDIFAYDAGRLAAGLVKFEHIGFKMEDRIIKLPVREAFIKYKAIEGSIVKVEHPFGNICTNVPRSLIEELEIMPGDELQFEIFESEGLIHNGTIPFVNTFGEVNKKSPLAYIDSSNRLGLAINMGNFAAEYKIKAGMTWMIRIKYKDR